MPATGPTTPEGKAIASRNRLTHGLRSTAIVLPEVEKVEDWKEFEDDIDAAVSPAGPLEDALASRLAELLWRIRRVAGAERQMIEDLQYREDRAEYRRQMDSEAIKRGLVTSKNFYATVPVDIDFTPPPARTLPSPADIAAIVRYEAHLNRQIVATLHELEVLQRRRNGESLPLARVDLNALIARVTPPE